MQVNSNYSPAMTPAERLAYEAAYAKLNAAKKSKKT